MGDMGDCAGLASSPVCVLLVPGLTGVLPLEPLVSFVGDSISIGTLSCSVAQQVIHKHIHIQWNLYIKDALRPAILVLNGEVSSSRRYKTH